MVGSPADVLHGLETRPIALDLEAINLPFEVAVADLQQMRRNLPRLRMNLACCHRDRGARHGVERDP